ncbi:MAG: APC family permease [Bdellovibrionales bacterium]|nr:APC family permease [Bdellovibrionales bacterium]
MEPNESTASAISVQASAKDKQLIRGLGIVGLIAASFNCMVGGGIFRLPASVYKIAGTASPIVYLICFLVMLAVVTVFIQVGRDIESSGGPYAYVQPVLGKYPAFLCGVLLWALATFAMAAVAAAYAGFVAAFVPSLDNFGGHAAILFVTFAVLTYFNVVGVKTGSKVSIVLSVVKILPLALLVFAGLPQLHTEQLTLPAQLDFPALGRGAMVLIFAFTGIECALIPSGEIKNPHETLPRSLYAALILVLFLYLGVQLVSQSELGAEMAAVTGSGQSPLAQAAGLIMGPIGAFILSVGAVLSTLGYLSAITLTLPRTLYTFARDGYLPSRLSDVHPEYHTPMNAIIVQVFVAWLLSVSSLFEHLAVLSNLSAILMYMICAIAAIKFGKRAVPTLAILAMGALLLTVTGEEWLSVIVVVVLSSIGYWIKSKSPVGA